MARRLRSCIVVVFIHSSTCRSLFVLVRLSVPLKAAVRCRRCPSRVLLSSSRQKKYHYLCEIETGFLCGDGARVILRFARVKQQVFRWTHKPQANVDNFYVRRRAECFSLGYRREHVSLRSDTSLAAKRRADALHVVYFVQTNTNPARQLLLLCVYSRMIHSHERRALGALVSLFSRSEPAPCLRRPTASCSLVAVRRVDCVHATWLY